MMTVELPPQVARYAGYETAFIQMIWFLLRAVRLPEQRLYLNPHSSYSKYPCACPVSCSNNNIHSPDNHFESQTTILLGIGS